MNDNASSAVTNVIKAVLSFATLLAALAFVLGWIYKQYYFGAFGLAHESLVFPVYYYLVASWFTVESFLFLLTLFLVAVYLHRLWFYVYFVAYALVPISAHWAFSYLDYWPARFLIDNRHNILKFGALIPAAFFVLVCMVGKLEAVRKYVTGNRWKPEDSRILVVIAIIAIAWALSAAKHFGSYDAQRALRTPEGFLPAIDITFKDSMRGLSQLTVNSNCAESQEAGTGEKTNNQPGCGSDNLEKASGEKARRFRLLLLNDGKYYVWDTKCFKYSPSSPVRILVIPQEAVANAVLCRGLVVKVP